ncbi:MAG: Microtubule-associated serine/threonine-protein kinase 4 [Paramarteilia canceri]
MSIRLVDFGLSALALKYELSHLTTWKKQSSFVGTPFYIAPEVLLNTDYGRPVDWWALGIIIFEMHYGTPPYLGDSISEIFHSILEDTLRWPDDQHNEEPVIAASPAAKATISRLLVKLPSDRLGTNDDYLVSKHKYFANVDWTNLLSEIEADSALSCKSNDDNDTQVVYRNRNRNSVMSEDRVSVSSKLETDKVMHDFSVVSQKMIDLINRTRQNDQKKA